MPRADTFFLLLVFVCCPAAMYPCRCDLHLPLQACVPRARLREDACAVARCMRAVVAVVLQFVELLYRSKPLVMDYRTTLSCSAHECTRMSVSVTSRHQLCVIVDVHDSISFEGVC